VTRKYRKDVKRLMTEVRRVLNDVWDPIGVFHRDLPDGLTWPEDEYDCCVGPIVSMLTTGATDDEINEYLLRQAAEHMGLSPGRKQAKTIAALRKIVCAAR